MTYDHLEDDGDLFVRYSLKSIEVCGQPEKAEMIYPYLPREAI